MQSSTAAIAVTLSAYYAGAVGLEQGCALIIGQNIGTATSSALAAIGAMSGCNPVRLSLTLSHSRARSLASSVMPLLVGG
jgi:phosphate:Na+ symporter